MAAAVRADSDLCWLCGHPGARTVDHDPPLAELKARGLDPNSREFLRIAHGAPNNQCPTPSCRQYCNQLKGTGRSLPPPTGSRRW